jgi:hypothetical protein
VIKRFGLLLVATMSIVAFSVSQANAALNITIDRTLSTISFYGSGGTLSSTLPQNFAIAFSSPALVGSGFTNAAINPGAELAGGPFSPGPSVSTLNSATLFNGILSFKGTASLSDFYFTTGFTNIDLSGANLAGIADGATFHSDTMYDSTFTPIASIFSGGVNLTIKGVAAVPEPASMLYGSLVAGSMGLTYLRRRRAAKA